MLSALLLSLLLAQTPPTESGVDPVAVPPAAPTPYPPAVPPAEPTPSTDASASAAPAAPAAALPAPKSPMAGFVDGEGFRIKDEEGNYMLRFGLQAAVKFEPQWTEGEPQLRKAIQFMRPVLRGNLVKPWIKFWISMELGGNPPYLLDAYFDIAPVQAFDLRIGQQYSPFSRQEQLGPQQLFFPEWSPVADYFWPGRDKGVEVLGMFLDKKIEYYVSAFSGSPLRQISIIPGNYSVQARVAFNPLGFTNEVELPFTDKGEALPFRFSIGLGGYTGKIQTAEENFNSGNGQFFAVPTGITRRQLAGGLDAWIQGGPVIVSAEAYVRKITPLDGTPEYVEHGGFAQAILSLWRKHLAAGAQVAWLDNNRSVANNSTFMFEAQVAWFIHAPDLVLKLRYAHFRQEIPSDPDFKLPIRGGNSNVATLQFNASF